MEYESPISIYTTEIATQIGEEFDKMVLTAIKKVGVEVDKDELAKALEYDRDQYEKGYLDGRRYKPPIITNADRIRSMSDADLATWFHSVCAPDHSCSGCKFDQLGCTFYEWLKEDAQDDQRGQDPGDE